MPLTPLEEAVAHVLAACPPLEAVVVGRAEAVGCVLAEPVVANEDVPPFANTAMDGIAVRAADVAGASEESPVRLAVAGFLPAGRAFAGTVGAGQAVRIMTGAPMPDGADAVVPVEELDVSPGGDDRVVDVRKEVGPGAHVRFAGGDVRTGTTVFPAGTLVTAPVVGVLASIGVFEVTVVRRPRIGVLSTGDELVADGRALAPGQIRESNRPALLETVAAAGWEAVDLGIAVDTEEAIGGALDAALEGCDALLTTGGVSMGDVDLVKVLLDQRSGGAFRWFQLALKPAKPFAFGVLPRPDGLRPLPVFGLPGNPVSSLVSFECLGRPALRRLAGHPDERLRPAALRGAAPDGFPRRPDGKLHLVRVRIDWVDGVAHARESGGQDSNVLSAFALADALALVPDGDGIAPGDPVTLWLLG